jgi:hypothetical protein
VIQVKSHAEKKRACKKHDKKSFVLANILKEKLHQNRPQKMPNRVT